MRAASTTRANGQAVGRVEVEQHVRRLVGRVGAALPGVQLDAAEVDQPQERHRVVHDHVAAGLLPGLAASRQIDPPHPLRGVVDRVLEEELPLDSVGVALEDHRAAGEVRHEHRRHAQVVVEQVPLGDPLAGPVGLVEVRERDGALALLHPPAAARRREGAARHVGRRVPGGDQAAEDRRPQPPVGGALGVAHLAGDLGAHPTGPRGRRGDLVDEGRLRRLGGAQPVPEPPRDRVGEAGSDV